jgi:hypothetical protein
MKYDQLIYDNSTFGTTGKSLKMLRNALANNLRDKILILQVQTDDILCGFFVFNKTTGTVTYSGDGFRTDGGGEGSRGFKAAEKLIQTFGGRIQYPYNDLASERVKRALNITRKMDYSEIEFAKEMLYSCNQIMEDCQFEDSEFDCLYEAIPHY